MSRTIKFRAWDEKRKAYTYAPDEFSSSIGPYFLTLDGRIYIDGVFQKHLLLEQSTGLLDRNGKEIYEGDILDDGGGTGEVRWIPEHCAFCVVSPDCGIGASFHHLESGDGKRLLVTVVIGNIHEEVRE